MEGKFGSQEDRGYLSEDLPGSLIKLRPEARQSH